MLKNNAILYGFIFVFIVYGSTLSHATLIDFLGGKKAIQDAGNEFKASVDHAKAAADALIVSGNAAAESRLAQVNKIVDDTLTRVRELKSETASDALSIIEKAKSDIQEIEKQIFSELNQVIWNAECSGRRVLLQDLQNALGGLGRIVGLNEIKITPPLQIIHPWYHKLCFWCSDEVKFKIRDPFGNTYIEIRDYMLSSIDAASDKDPAHSIASTYAYIAELAKKTSCFYQGSLENFNKEYVKYREKSAAWHRVVDIEVTR